MVGSGRGGRIGDEPPPSAVEVVDNAGDLEGSGYSSSNPAYAVVRKEVEENEDSVEILTRYQRTVQTKINRP